MYFTPYSVTFLTGSHGKMVNTASLLSLPTMVPRESFKITLTLQFVFVIATVGTCQSEYGIKQRLEDMCKGHGQYDKTFYREEVLKSARRGESIEISLPSC